MRPGEIRGLESGQSEAAVIAESIITRLRSLPYETLVDRLLNDVETEEVSAESGVQHQVEIQAMWDSGRPGDLRVLVGVDDGSLRGSFSPVDRALVIANDGSFVGEP